MTPEVSSPREIPLESPEHWKVSGRFPSEPKPIIELSTDLTLESIPQPVVPCLGCRSPVQREIVSDYLVETGNLRVEGYAPGYGCTSCPAKFMDTRVFIGFQKVAEIQFLEAGDSEMADRLRERFDYRQNPEEWLRKNMAPFQVIDR